MRLLVPAGDEGEKGKVKALCSSRSLDCDPPSRPMVPTVEEGVLDPDVLTRVLMGDEVECSAGGISSLKT